MLLCPPCIQKPIQLLWKVFNHVAINAQKLSIHYSHIVIYTDVWTGATWCKYGCPTLCCLRGCRISKANFIRRHDIFHYHNTKKEATTVQIHHLSQQHRQRNSGEENGKTKEDVTQQQQRMPLKDLLKATQERDRWWWVVGESSRLHPNDCLGQRLSERANTKVVHRNCFENISNLNKIVTIAYWESDKLPQVS